jgi:hypothetical protein
LYWLLCCHLTFRKIWYCLIKTRIDLVSLSFSNETYKKNHVNYISIRPMDIKVMWNSSNQNRRISVTLEWSNGDFQKFRRLGFTFTFHFNVIKQLVFCIGQYEFLWTLEINIHLSLKASVNIVFKVHENSYWPQQKTIIV